MLFTETKLPGVVMIEPERRHDERGFFARTYCEEEFGAHGLDPTISQCGVSFNAVAGTLRGMHYQVEPYGEVKLVRCTMGAIYDVVIDLRRASTTYCQWVAAELSSENRRMLYIPEGFAHGFLTLIDNSEVFYQISEPYRPGSGAGVRWNDPTFDIEWPFTPTVMADRDASYPDFPPEPSR